MLFTAAPKADQEVDEDPLMAACEPVASGQQEQQQQESVKADPEPTQLQLPEAEPSAVARSSDLPKLASAPQQAVQPLSHPQQPQPQPNHPRCTSAPGPSKMAGAQRLPRATSAPAATAGNLLVLPRCPVGAGLYDAVKGRRGRQPPAKLLQKAELGAGAGHVSSLSCHRQAPSANSPHALCLRHMWFAVLLA